VPHIGNPAVREKPVDEPAPEIECDPSKPHGGQETLKGSDIRGAFPALVLGYRLSLHARAPGEVGLRPVERFTEEREHSADMNRFISLPALPRLCHVFSSRAVVMRAHSSMRLQSVS